MMGAAKQAQPCPPACPVTPEHRQVSLQDGSRGVMGVAAGPPLPSLPALLLLSAAICACCSICGAAESDTKVLLEYIEDFQCAAAHKAYRSGATQSLLASNNTFSESQG
eukprot:1160894-Pelagomonas_calceolata.AAC.2